MTTLNNYKNYGDVSLEHGFILVLQDEHDTNCYRILKTDFDCDTENYMLFDLYVDITDSWIDWKDVQSYADTDLNNPIQMAIDSTSYYASENFGCHFILEFEKIEELENSLKNDYLVNFNNL